MAALFLSRSTTACFRHLPRTASPVLARAEFSTRRTEIWTPEDKEIADLQSHGLAYQGKADRPNTSIAEQTAEAQQTRSRRPKIGETSRRLQSMGYRAAYSTGAWTSRETQSITNRYSQGRSSGELLPSFRKNNQQMVRHASTNASSSPSAAGNLLTWDRFFKLRRNRRWINAGCSIVTAIASVVVFGPMLAERDFDTWGAQISGMDPVVVLGVSTISIAAVGWLMGPTIGNGGFRFWVGRKGWSREIAVKEKSFYARIKKYRADASSSSPQNPIPDYYGEKVASVKDYRRWLKDQRAFNLKKNKNMI